MFDVIYSPKKAIENAKKTKNTNKEILTLLITSIIIAVTILITMLNLGTTSFQETLISSLITIVIVFVSGLIFTALFYLALNMITNKGTFYDSLKTITNTLIITSTGFLIGALFMLIPLIGIILTLLTLILTITYAYAIFIKTITTLTNTEILPTIIATIIVLIALITATQITSLLIFATNPLMMM